MSCKDFVAGAVFGTCLSVCGFILWLNYTDSVGQEALRDSRIRETKRFDADLPDQMLMAP